MAEGRLVLASVANREYLEALYEQWRQDPSSVDESWHGFFQGLELGQQSREDGGMAREPLPGAAPPGAAGRQAPDAAQRAAEARAQSNVASLIYGYRTQGHLCARIDPLGGRPACHPALDLECFGFTDQDLDRVFDTGHLWAPDQMSLREIVDTLRDIYCGPIGVEYIHIQDREVRRWLQSQMEPTRNRPSFDRQRKRDILEALVDAELFESFTHTRYPGQKRFSLEGSESVIPAMRALVALAPEVGVQEIVLGMSHRGRLNVLANILGLSYETIFSAFEGNFLPLSVHGDGDVKYHRGYSSTCTSPQGHQVHLSLTANPSHLEAVYPVVEGRVRAKQRQHGDTEERRSVLPLVLHGDAAFAGQGVVAETLNFAQVPGYRTGGTLHLIINNQIGFTTSPTEARSTVYSTEVAKMIEAPIFHVNGDDPEAVVFAAELALRFRQSFGRDVVIDLICYRRHGHNEADDPAFTQPVLYQRIRDHQTVRELYASRLSAEGHISADEERSIAASFRDVLKMAHERARRENPAIEVQAFEKLWEGLDAPFSFAPVETGAPHEVLVEVARALTTVPADFQLNPKVERMLPRFFEAVNSRGPIGWALAESLAFGSLLHEGTPVRLSGQDSARGTFSQRHAVWQDMETGAPYIPLQHVRDGQARFCVYNSPLSEASVLAFEYGYAVTEPRMLIAWEAQFGDFVNGAQVVVDQFIAGSESKWQRDAGVVLLLPHGYEGQGPEHSSAYLERFLAGAAEFNVQVCYPSTPAQYFHLLRRQMRRPFRLPLVVMTPKSLLRSPLCVSAADELVEGRFEELLDDPARPERPQRLVLCSGKLYYDLIEARKHDGQSGVAIVRLEQLYPLHEEKLLEVVEPYRNAREVVWAQEESQNRGAWSYILPHLLRLFPEQEVRYIGREASASPATGSLRIHRQEQERVVQAVLGRVSPLEQPEAGIATLAVARALAR